MAQTMPHRWDDEEFSRDIGLSLDHWRGEQMSAPLEEYRALYRAYEPAVRSLLERSRQLEDLEGVAKDCLLDARLFYAFRYLAAPPISEDNLKLLVDSSLSRAQLEREGSDVARRAAQVVLTGLDTERFPWVLDKRPPTTAEVHAATVATTALIASNRTQTARRTSMGSTLELLVGNWLESEGLERVEPRRIDNLSQAPAAGEFCGECEVAGRKADVVVRLWDGRLMPCECKVSNSFLNSIKRLNNDAAVKAETWITEMGRANVVPCAVLSGAFKLRHLVDAQQRGLSVFWAHDLGAMTGFVRSTRSAYAG